jgi:hypothetical protein
MSSLNLTNPVVQAALTAANNQDRAAFLDLLTPDASLSDDGTQRNLTEWIDREIFTSNGHFTAIESQEADGLRLIARFSNDTWGEMRTQWRFQLTGDKISRIDTGQA